MLKSLASGEVSALTLHLSLEHERLHQETLCYMLAQQQKQQWEAAHLRADGSLLENGAAFTETLARVRTPFPESKPRPVDCLWRAV